ncbi:alpha/beta fold hydrolase [Elusimicrobiota bacterium]
MVSVSKEYNFTSNWLDVEGQRMHYLDEGEGHPVLMLHGNPTWSFYYRNLVSRLSKKFRCIVPDHIGCGYSDKPQDYSYNLKTHIENCDYLLKALDISRIDLIVHDWGGAIGMGVAVKDPSRINKITIMNSAAFRSDSIPVRIAICRVPVLGDIIVRRFNLFLGAARYMGTSRPGGLEKPVWKGYLKPYKNYNSRIAIHRFIKDIPLSPSDSSYSLLKEIEEKLKSLSGKPVLFAWGCKDFCFTDKFLDRWLDFFPNGKAVRFPEASHFVLEDNEEVVGLIESFLENE